MATPDIGDRVRISVTWANIAGTATDPTTVTFRAKPPSGTEIDYTYGTDAELVRSGTGAYYVDLTLTEAGTWLIRWKATGALVAAEEATISVRRSGFSNP